jgi:methylated-DNA-[protein]-cysteine S-methyltransferase
MLEAYQAKFPAPFAILGIRTTTHRVIGIDYLPRGAAPLAPLNALAEKACAQIERYLADPGYRFSLPFDYDGTAFQCRVWRAIRAIPAGGTLTYSELARRLETAPRPVGGACGANRLTIVIHCHRVLAAHGLGGLMHAAGFPIKSSAGY